MSFRSLASFVEHIRSFTVPSQDPDHDILWRWFETAQRFFQARLELYEAQRSTDRPGASDSGEERTRKVTKLEETIAEFKAKLWNDVTLVQNIINERPDLAGFQADVTMICSHLSSRSVAAPVEIESVLGNGSQEDHASRVSDQAASTHGDSQVGSMAPQSPAGEISQQQAIQNTEPHKTTDGGTGGGKVTIPPSGALLARYRSEVKRAILIQISHDPRGNNLEICRGLDADGLLELPKAWRGKPTDRSFADAYSDPSRRHKVEAAISRVRRDLREQGLLPKR
jgi:hypothetical protein